MLVPHDAAGKTLNLKITVQAIHAVVGVALFAVIIVISSLVYTGHMSRKLVYYGNAIEKNKEQKAVIETFSKKTDEVGKSVLALEEEDNRLRKLLGLRSWQSKAKLSTHMESNTDKVMQDLKSMHLKLAERKQSFNELKTWVNTVQARFANTPSEWPLYGNLMSYFGYRVFPWRGFHAGIDISASFGAPVHATANGVVTYTGWRTGYGKTVEISHGNGLSTLFAHNSRFAVNNGQKIRKGQVIAYVGTSGYSTGPHVHYEVHKQGRAINPMALLNLDILSASKVWRQ